MTLRLALPLFGCEVAPRFCSANHILVVEVENSVVVSSRRLSVLDSPWSERLSSLADQGVKVLICGGFNRHFLPLAESLGIRVEWGLTGRVERLIDAYCRGELDRYRFCRGRLHEQGHQHRWRQRNARIRQNRPDR